MKSILLLATLLSVSANAARPRTVRAVVCKADGGATTLVFDEKNLKIVNPAAESNFKTLNHKVEGAGEKARTVYTFENGVISFHDKYGCIEDVRNELNTFIEMKIQSCLWKGRPPCPEGDSRHE